MRSAQNVNARLSMSQHEFEMTKRQPIDKGDDSAYDPIPLMRKKTMTIVEKNHLLQVPSSPVSPHMSNPSSNGDFYTC